jgi:hypothetical protein
MKTTLAWCGCDFGRGGHYRQSALRGLACKEAAGQMQRRSFTFALTALAAASLVPRLAGAQTPAKPAVRAQNVVLVHGLFADGSCWSEVIPRLQAAGLNVTAVQNPLTTLDEAVASARKVLARQDGGPCWRAIPSPA